MNSLKEIVNQIEAEGFQGAHTLIFLIRYASLAQDRELSGLIDNTMADMSTLPESPMLLAAYKEWYRATGRGAEIVSFLEARSGNDEDFGMPWDFLELYKETFRQEYLEKAISGAEFILEHFHEMLNPAEVYDIEEPSFNSQVAVLYAELARYTQDEKWINARNTQNRFIRILADKYPTKVCYGLIALLGEEFGEQTVVCEGEIPQALLQFYAPTTAILYRPSEVSRISLMKDGKLEEIML